MSARNAAVAVKSAKSAYAESCDKKEGKIKSPKIKKIFSLKISRPEKKCFYLALNLRATPAKECKPKDIFCAYKIIR